MAAQEYYDSFKQQPPNARPSPASFKAKPQAASSAFSSTPPRSYGNGNGGGAASAAPYPNLPYPATPDPTPQRRSPRSQQYLAPPGGPPPGVGSSYLSPQTSRASRAGPRPSDPYAYPAQAYHRSTSEPPGNRRVSQSAAGGRQGRRYHGNSRDDSSDYDDYDDYDDLDRSRSHSQAPAQARSRSSHRPHSDSRRSAERSRSHRHTFLGAGGGAIVGDAIFPGLGTLGGLLIGGWGGHEYSKRRSKRSNSEGKYDDSKPPNWNGRKGNYGDGVTVRSEWGLIER